MPASADLPAQDPDDLSGVAERSGDDGSTGLTAQERAILAMEERTFRYVGAKERRIREELALTPTAYYVRLNALLDRPEALRAAPALVHRLRARRVSASDAGHAA
ncbi:DUF3263 domain-containing protein [Brachybacterium halotolerans subsp. kimchii]|uniref:DUF3263 domain-containing protein n=1 Tax=Brachybacterium halotolerans TaxID=2795215 RepID=UPI001E3B97D0|nr:DUF3263 domain-containing protein [Brachybacterium halotolerans]UEJ82108.1 DUF3263 domain-containing protein [Brachybacterium halotolerans subsp. kimchii]